MTQEIIKEPEKTVVMRFVLSQEQADAQFVCLFDRLSGLVNKNAIDQGIWEGANDSPEYRSLKVLLMHSELSKVVEAMQLSNPPDEKLPQFSSVEVKLAACIIKIMDFAEHYELKLGDALLAKYNLNRSMKQIKTI